MSAPALPLSEHAARATASFARLLAEAEGTNKAQERHIDTSISHDPGTNLHHTTSDECADGDGDGKRRVYSPSFLLQFKERYTEPPPGLPKSGLGCLISSETPMTTTRDRPGRDERPSIRRGESARDIATLRLHRGRRAAGTATSGRAGSPYPPGYSPPPAGRPKTPGSPTVPRWKQFQAAPTPPRFAQKAATSSAPSTPRMWKRAEGPVEEEEGEFNPEEMEESGGWRRERVEAAPAVLSDGAKAWTPRRRQGGLSKDQELLSQVKGILNKLSVDNFHQLCGQLFALEIPSLDVLKGIVDIIFDKATLEPTFSSLYAQMCSDWVNKAPKFKEPGSERDMTFRRALLNRCQAMFEKKEEGETHPTKRVMIGNVIFIGELYRKKVITHKITHICLSTLLGSVTHAIADKKAETIDEDVECLCKLFIIVGRDLDVLSSDSHKRMDEYFRALRGIMTNKALPARIRFLVQDVIELRQAGWTPKTLKAGK